MKRIQAACLCQTLHFQLKEDAEHDWAVKQCQQEVEAYKRTLERKHVAHRILEETVQADGSIAMKLIRQYNFYPVSNYLD